MDELKILIEAVAGLPTLTLWVLVGFLIYKLAVIGSIYGLIRLGIERLYSWLTTPAEKFVEITGMIEKMAITHDGSHRELISQIHRLRGKAVGDKFDFIHNASVNWLREAIDAKEQLDREMKK